MRTVRFALRYVRKHWLAYLLGIASLIIVDMSILYIPQFTGMITDGLAEHSMVMADVLRLLGSILAVGCVVMLGRFGWRFFLFGASRTIEKELRNDLFAHL